MDTEFSYDRYFTLLAEKKSLFIDYNETTRCLKQSLEEKSDNQLKTFLENRHRIMHRIDRINKSINSGTKNLENDSVIFRKAEIISIQKEIEILMDNSLNIEKECMDLVLREKNEIKDDILSHRQNHRRNIGYQNFGSGVAKYIDTEIR